MKIMYSLLSIIIFTISIAKGQKTVDEEFFPGFEPFNIETSGATIFGLKKGDGPAILLLHGYPESHLEWHKIAPKLAENFTVVVTDLRGYGDSSKPEDGVNHSGYSKREMAKDQVEVLRSLGFEHFNVVAHDRCARVAHRMALDYPENITKLITLDIVPTYDLYSTTDKAFASMYWHWFFLIQRAPLPETLLSTNAEFMLGERTFRGMVPNQIPERIYEEYLKNFKNPATLHAMCEDYRAGASIDMEQDEADLGKKVICPMLLLWGARGAMEGNYDVLGIWRKRALNVEGHSLLGGHWLPEQVPDVVYEAVINFIPD